MSRPVDDSGLLRSRDGDGSGRVTYPELFFDLVFVFAVTQLSHALLDDLSAGGTIRVLLLLLAVWWVWIFTGWVTNWLDPERWPVRLMLFGLMLAGLVLSTSLPTAFGERGLVFAAAFVTMQVGRSAFSLWAMRGTSEALRRNFQRMLCWLSLSGLFWLAGGFASEPWRLPLWALALVIEYLAPAAGFWTPGLGRSSTTDWDIAGSHLAERCGLFIIIALGESILVTGATVAGLDWSPTVLAAFVASFAASVIMWWIYFDSGAERGTRSIEDSGDPGRLARLAYTYLHLPIVGGIILVAVGDELTLQHPTGHAGLDTILAMLGGTALYVLGNCLFKWAVAGRPPLSHLIGLGLLAATAPLAFHMSPLTLTIATTAVLAVVAGWERWSLTRSHAV